MLGGLNLDTLSENHGYTHIIAYGMKHVVGACANFVYSIIVLLFGLRVDS